MTCRFVRRGSAAAAALAVMVVVGACDSAVTGTAMAGPNPHRFAAHEAFGAAVDALESRPVMRYTTSTSGAGSAKLEVRVSRTGAAFGTGSVDGDKLTVAAFDDKLFLKASQQRWRSLGAEPGEARKFANRLSLVEASVLGFDPGAALTPKEVADALRQAFAEHQTAEQESTLEREVERLKTAGDEVYRIPLGPNYVDVTVTRPFRIVSTDLPLGGGDGVQLLAEGTRTELSVGDADTLRTLYRLLDRSLTKIKSTAVNVPDFRLQEGTGDLDCQIGGKCTAKVEVSNSYTARDGLPVSKFEVSMKVTMRATGLGARSCSDKASMRPNKSQTMSCTADFALAPSYTPRSYPVRATWNLLAVAKYTPDTKKLAARLSKELNELLGEI